MDSVPFLFSQTPFTRPPLNAAFDTIHRSNHVTSNSSCRYVVVGVVGVVLTVVAVAATVAADAIAVAVVVVAAEEESVA